MFAAGVPFVHPDLARTPIKGELFRVSLADVTKLDGLEGHPDFYFREQVDIAPLADSEEAAATMADLGCKEQGKPLRAWLYFNRFISDLADSMSPAVFVATGDFHDAAKFGNPSAMG